MSADEDSVALDVNMEDSERDGENTVPKSTKKKKMKPRIQPLKRKATGPTNSGIAARKINISLNNSVVKQTLRSNNRSLARALEMARQEYSVLQQQFVALQTHQIDCERRMKKRLTDVRAVLEVVGSKLVTSVSLLEEAQALCTVDQEDFDATTLTPGCDNNLHFEVPAVPDLRPRPAPQRNILAASEQQAESPEVVPNITVTSPKVSPQLTEDESPSSRSLEEGPESALGDVIENMKADITHVMTSLQGYRAPPVSMAPADVSVVMEMSCLMDQLPPMFDEVDQDTSQSGPQPKRERTHSRSRSGRRSAMIYRAGGSLDNVTGEPEAAPEEKGPRRSIRARSRSRQRPRKTYNEDQEEEEPEVDAEGRSKETSPGKEAEAVDVPKVPETQSEVTTSQEQAPQEPLVVENEHLLKVFVPRNEIPRTPPSRRTSEVVSSPTEEVEPDASCGVEIPKFISFDTKTNSKAAKKRLSVSKKKAQRNLGAQTKKDKKTVLHPAESQPTKLIQSEPMTPDISNKSEKVSPTPKDSGCSEQPAEPEEVEEEVEQNGPESPKKSESTEELETTEVAEEPVTVPVPGPRSRRSHLRRGTFSLATQVAVEAADPPEAQKDTDSSDRPRRQRRGTFCMTEAKAAVVKESPEDTVPESPTEPAAGHTGDKQNKREQRHKRGTYFVAPEQEEKEDPSVEDVDFGEEIVNEQEITLIDDLGDDSDDIYGGETVCFNVDLTNDKQCVDSTKYEEEDMELTEVIDFAAFQLEAMKFPVPSFIKNEQDKLETEDAIVEDEKTTKDTTKSRGKLVLKPKLRKKKRGGKDTENSESKSDMCSVEETSVEVSSTSIEKTDKQLREKGVDSSESKAENESVEESLTTKEDGMKKRKEKDGNSKTEDDSVNDQLKEESLVSKDAPEKKKRVRKETENSSSKSSKREEEKSVEENSGARESVDQKKRRGKDTKSGNHKSDINSYLFDDDAQDENSTSKEKVEKPQSRNVVEILDSNVDSEDAFKKPDVKLIKPLAKVKAAASKVQKKHYESSSDNSSDSDKEKPKFQMMSSRPGQIVFKAGRKKVEDLKPVIQKVVSGKAGSKVKSLLPRPDRPRSKTARSKTRLLSVGSETRLGFTEAEKKEDGPPKSVFDMSLNESITVLPQMKYGDFREQNPGIEAMKEALKSNQNGEESVPYDASHGIMLVMGNGKRTKPRVRSKSVTYSRKLAEVHLRTPSASSSSDLDTPRNIKEFAGKTPPKRKLKQELPKNDVKDTESIDDLKDDEILIPDTPDIKVTKKAKRSVKGKDIARKIDSVALSASGSVDDEMDSFCSLRSSLASVVNDSTLEKTESGSMPAPSETAKTQPKKKLSLAKPQSKKEETVVRESPRNSAKKSLSSSKTSKSSAEKSDRSSTGSTSSVSSTTKRSLNTHDEFKMPFDDVEPKRPRRGASQVSYKELSLNAKLRRGDPISSTLYKEGEHNMKSAKEKKAGKRSRSVLTTITNVPLDADD